jgi:hypothetical protein
MATTLGRAKTDSGLNTKNPVYLKNSWMTDFLIKNSDCI